MDNYNLGNFYLSYIKPSRILILKRQAKEANVK